MKKNILIFLTIVLSFLGFLDATYLTILHYKNIIPPCSLAHGCETVLTSKYATIGPVPIALFGSIYYVVLMLLLGILLQNKKDSENIKQKIETINSSLFNLRSLIFILSLSGIIVSAVLVYLQAFVIHAFCQYCLGSEGINVLLFVFCFLLKKSSNK